MYAFRMRRLRNAVSFCAIAAILPVAGSAAAQAIHGRGGITLPAPPDVETAPVTDDYFGTKSWIAIAI